MPFGHSHKDKKDGATVENDLEKHTHAKPEKGGESVKRTDIKLDDVSAPTGQHHNNSHNAQHLRDLEREMGTSTHHTGYMAPTTIGTGVITPGATTTTAYTTTTSTTSGLTTGQTLAYEKDRLEMKGEQLKYGTTATFQNDEHQHKHHHKSHNADTTYGTTATTGYATTTTTATSAVSNTLPVERVEHAAAVVEERIVRREQEVIQPVITRDIERTEVHQINQPIHEVTVLPTQQNSRILPEQNIEHNLNTTAIPVQVVPQTRVIEAEREVVQVTEKPIVQERVHTKIIEDIQPVIYRDVIQPVMTMVQQPVHERVVEQAQVITETRPLIQNQTTSYVEQIPIQTFQTTQQAVILEQPALLVQQQPVQYQQQSGGIVHEVFHGQELGHGHLVRENIIGGPAGLSHNERTASATHSHGHHDKLSHREKKEIRKAEEGMTNMNLNGQAL